MDGTSSSVEKWEEFRFFLSWPLSNRRPKTFLTNPWKHPRNVGRGAEHTEGLSPARTYISWHRHFFFLAHILHYDYIARRPNRGHIGGGGLHPLLRYMPMMFFIASGFSTYTLVNREVNAPNCASYTDSLYDTTIHIAQCDRGVARVACSRD